MTAIVLTVISGGGVAFLIRFFIALCKESKGRACHVVRIAPHSRWDGEAEELPSNVSDAIARSVQPEQHPNIAEGRQRPLITERRYSHGS